MFNKKNCLRDEELEKSMGRISRETKDWAVMYIDDLSVGEVLDLDIATVLYSQQVENKSVHARKCEEYFNTIRTNSASIGMQIKKNTIFQEF